MLLMARDVAEQLSGPTKLSEKGSRAQNDQIFSFLQSIASVDVVS